MTDELEWQEWLEMTDEQQEAAFDREFRRARRRRARRGDLAVSGWQPIETAPKDGTTILIYRRMPPWHVRGSAYWFIGSDGSCGWISRGLVAHGRSPGELGLSEPTHWMPLESPPCPK